MCILKLLRDLVGILADHDEQHHDRMMEQGVVVETRLIPPIEEGCRAAGGLEHLEKVGVIFPHRSAPW
jgi:hypothetical protein